MRFLSLLTSFLSLGVASVEDDVAVVTLTKENFDSFVDTNPIALVEFFAPWCGHCKRLAPEYEEAAKVLKGSVPLCAVDATQDPEIAQRFSVSGYPTIKLFRNGKPEEYSGGRTKDTIISWVEAMTTPPVVIVDDKAATLEVKPTLKRPVVVGEFESNTSPAFKVFETVADSNRAQAFWVAYFTENAKSTATLTRFEDEPETSEVTDSETFDQWYNNVKFPNFGKIDGDTYNQYISRPQDIVWFAGTEEEYDAASPAVKSVAKNLRDSYSFVWLDSAKFKSHSDQNLGIQDYPGLVVQTKKGRYVFPSTKFDDSSVIRQFFDDIAAGKITRDLKSEAIPETNDEPVKVVVGNTFEAIVLKEDTDCLLEVYAPWCGHCKKLEPIYTEFAELVSEVPHLTVAKMDGTANESPSENFEWQAFPSIFFVKAGSDVPITFDGERTVSGILEFVKANSSKKIDVQEKQGKDEL